MTKSWKTLKTDRLGREGAARADERALARVEELTLRELRRALDVTQTELADAAEMTQSELSRLESRSDHRLSTLKRYINALGGDIEITVVIGKRRVKLTEV